MFTVEIYERFDGLSSSKGRADASGAGFRIDRVELGILHMTLDWSSHKRRIAGEGGVQAGGLNSSAHSRICTASTCSVLLRPSFVRAKSRMLERIGDAHDVPSVMECKRGRCHGVEGLWSLGPAGRH